MNNAGLMTGFALAAAFALGGLMSECTLHADVPPDTSDACVQRLNPAHSRLLEITCGAGSTAYKIVLTGAGPETFQAAVRDARVVGKQGEALVAALLDVAKGKISKVMRYKGGNDNDGPHGEPAFQRFDQDGALAEVMHARNSQLNDDPNGEPAWRLFYDGRLHMAEHDRDGVYNDASNGEAAVQYFHKNGMLSMAKRYKNGTLNDGPNSEPAWQWFNDDGTLVKAARFKDGELVKKLDGGEIAAYLREKAIQKTEIPRFLPRVP